MILRDEQWEKLEPLLLGKEGDPGMQGRDNRMFMEAVFWYVGARRWRNLPPEFGKWNTAYMRFRRWNMSGIWHRLKDAVKDDPELLAQFEKIVLHADNLRRKTVQKSTRRSGQQLRSWPARGNEGQRFGSGIDAGSDWLWLVMGSERQRVNSK